MEGIRSRYAKFFFFSRCATSAVGKMIPVLDPINRKPFLEALTRDEQACDDAKLLAGLLFSGGMRVSEALGLKKGDFRRDADGSYFAKVGVLKKRKRDIARDAAIHPLLAELLEKKLKSKRPNEFLFRERAGRGRPAVELTRQNALHKMKKLLGPGITNHCLRHSNVSMLMHLGYTDGQIAQILEMSVSNVSNYAHVNAARVMKQIYSADRP